MRSFPLVLLRPPLGAKPRGFSIQGLPLRGSNYLLPGVSGLAFELCLQVGDTGSRVGQLLLNQLDTHALNRPRRLGGCNRCSLERPKTRSCANLSARFILPKRDNLETFLSVPSFGSCKNFPAHIPNFCISVCSSIWNSCRSAADGR